MMSVIYIRLLAVAAITIAATGATFSIMGLSKLFSGSPWSVALMAGALEFAKLVATGFLYRYWGHINRVMRVYLSFAVITLVTITSVGIFGFLSSAYMVSSLNLKTQEIQLKAMEDENARVVAQISDIKNFIGGLPKNRITKKMELQQEYEPQLRRLNKRSNNLLVEAEKLKMTMLKTHAEVGPAIYLAKALNMDIDTVVKWLIIFFVTVFDPLAVCLVFCLNLAIRLHEKYRGNEARIAAHALSTPVDHRYKKAS